MCQLLIVDDETHVVERLTTTVDWTQIGIEEVHKALSGEEALSLLRQFSIDIVVTDIRMPGMSGLELVSEIKARWPKTKCILLSGYSEFAYAKEAIMHETKDYLLKPVKEAELLQSVRRVKDELEREWNELLSHRRLQYTLKEHLPFLQAKLLHEQLQGVRMSSDSLNKKLAMLELSAFAASPVSLMLVRLEKPFTEYDDRHLSLTEYAIGNMVAELYGHRYHIWGTKDVHDYLVFAMTPAQSHHAEEDPHAIERTATQLQAAVKTYLNGTISILTSPWGTFPDDLVDLYNRTVAALSKWIGNEHELFMRVEDVLAEPPVRMLQQLYEPPSLIHLMEAGRWDGALSKLHQIHDELQEKWPGSEEHILEVFLAVSSAFAYIAHRNKKLLYDLIGEDYVKMLAGSPFRSVHQMREWSARIMERLRTDADLAAQDSRSVLISDIKDYIDRNLSCDISLQAIADSVRMHPVYVSRIFKLETGENLSDYINRVRMAKAEYLLTNTKEKIFEIAAKLGYLRPHSFNQAFKKHLGMTPQEYRDGLIHQDQEIT